MAKIVIEAGFSFTKVLDVPDESAECIVKCLKDDAKTHATFYACQIPHNVDDFHVTSYKVFLTEEDNNDKSGEKSKG